MNSKNTTIDALRILMAVLVVMIHSASLIHDKNLGEFILLEGFGRVAVPFFFVVSGFYLEQTISNNKLSVWFSKIIKMYVVWNLFYLPFQAHVIDAVLDGNIVDINISSIPFDIFFGYWQLWFLPAVIIGALLINSFASSSTAKLLTTSVIILFFACTLWYLSINKIISMSGFWSNAVSIRNGVFFGFPLMTFGYLLAREKSSHFVTEIISSKGGLVLGLLLVAGEAIFGFYTTKAFYDLTFSSAIISVSLVAFAMKRPNLININIDGASLSTYLYMTHVAFFLLYSRYTHNAPLLFIVVLSSSLLMSLIIMKMKKNQTS